MNENTHKQSKSESINRKDVNRWSNPHRQIGHLSWYNPLLWIFIAIDIPIMIRWYWWHKRQSKKADRWIIAGRLSNSMQKCDFIINRDDVGPQETEYAKEIKRDLIEIADELNLQSDIMERHIESNDDPEN